MALLSQTGNCPLLWYTTPRLLSTCLNSTRLNSDRCGFFPRLTCGQTAESYRNDAWTSVRNLDATPSWNPLVLSLSIQKMAPMPLQAPLWSETPHGETGMGARSAPHRISNEIRWVQSYMPITIYGLI